MNSFAQYDLSTWLVDGLVERLIDPIGERVFKVKKAGGTVALLGSALLFVSAPAATAAASAGPKNFIPIPTEVLGKPEAASQNGDIDPATWAALVRAERAFVPAHEPDYTEPAPFF